MQLSLQENKRYIKVVLKDHLDFTYLFAFTQPKPLVYILFDTFYSNYITTLLN